MIKKLTAIGNSLGLIIERSILELLVLEKDTPLDVTTDGEVLIIRPVRDDHPTQVRAAAQRMMDVHDATLKRLAE